MLKECVYEKLSEKVFNFVVIDAIMKSLAMNEKDAIIYYKELIKGLTIESPCCKNEDYSSIRYGIVKLLSDKNIYI